MGTGWEQSGSYPIRDTLVELKVVAVVDSESLDSGATRYTLRKRITRMDTVRMDTTYTCLSRDNAVECDEKVDAGTFYDGYSTPSIHPLHRKTASYRVDTTGGRTTFLLDEGTHTWSPGLGLVSYVYEWPKGSTQGSAPTTTTRMTLRKFNGETVPQF